MSLKKKTIRTEFLRYIKDNNILLYHFTEKTGINSGTLSRVVNGLQPISVRVLDIITSEMGLQDGCFYDQYVDELFEDSILNWRRIRPFLQRCAELGRNECIERTVDLMMESHSYIKSLFEFAEIMNNDGKTEVALIIYRKVCEGERFQHSERLATCQYRIFKLSISENQQRNLECAVHFDPYVVRLSELEQLDAIKDLMNLYLSLRRWEKADQLAVQMGKLARVHYALKHKRKGEKEGSQEPSKPLFGYILYSDLVRGAVAEEQNDFQKALDFVSRYQNHDWIKERDITAENTKRQFREWAEGNRYLYQILSGDTEVLDQYSDYLAARENEILRGLFKLIKAANHFKMNIDHVLYRFEKNILCSMSEHNKIGSYTNQIIDDRLVFFLMDLADYYLNSERVRVGINYILSSLAISVKIKNDACLVRGFCAFDSVRHLANEDELYKFSKVIKEAYQK